MEKPLKWETLYCGHADLDTTIQIDCQHRRYVVSQPMSITLCHKAAHNVPLRLWCLAELSDVHFTIPHIVTLISQYMIIMRQLAFKTQDHQVSSMHH